MKMDKHLLAQPEAIIFDWDNTLVNTFELLKVSINKTLSHFGMATWTDQEIRQRSQLSAKDGLPIIFGDRWPLALEVFTSTYQTHAPEFLKALPGALSLLQANQSLNIRMAIVSNKRGGILRQEIESLGWGDYFEVVIGSGDLVEDKPSVVPVEHILQHMCLSKGVNIWFVGDMPVDWQCAEASGCLPIPIGIEMEASKVYPQSVDNCLELEKILLKA